MAVTGLTRYTMFGHQLQLPKLLLIFVLVWCQFATSFASKYATPGVGSASGAWASSSASAGSFASAGSLGWDGSNSIGNGHSGAGSAQYENNPFLNGASGGGGGSGSGAGANNGVAISVHKEINLGGLADGITGLIGGILGGVQHGLEQGAILGGGNDFGGHSGVGGCRGHRCKPDRPVKFPVDATTGVGVSVGLPVGGGNYPGELPAGCAGRRCQGGPIPCNGASCGGGYETGNSPPVPILPRPSKGGCRRGGPCNGPPKPGHKPVHPAFPTPPAQTYLPPLQNSPSQPFRPAVQINPAVIYPEDGYEGHRPARPAPCQSNYCNGGAPAGPAIQPRPRPRPRPHPRPQSPCRNGYCGPEVQYPASIGCQGGSCGDTSGNTGQSSWSKKINVGFVPGISVTKQISFGPAITSDDADTSSGSGRPSGCINGACGNSDAQNGWNGGSSGNGSGSYAGGHGGSGGFFGFGGAGSSAGSHSSSFANSQSSSFANAGSTSSALGGGTAPGSGGCGSGACGNLQSHPGGAQAHSNAWSSSYATSYSHA